MVMSAIPYQSGPRCEHNENRTTRPKEFVLRAQQAIAIELTRSARYDFMQVEATLEEGIRDAEPLTQQRWDRE
jgi:hypothetical protein